MFEIFALVLYSVQWLGVVLGVGAEVVLLVAHLMALHEHKPEWLGTIPAVRTAQLVGIILIVASGAGAMGYQFLIGQPALLLLPVFGFKWAIIVALVVAFFLEKHLTRGRAVLEGFAGATWLALFLVHSVAPVAPWLDLGVFYGGWLLVFGVVWGVFVLLMKYTGKVTAKLPDQKSSGLLSEPKNGSAGQTFTQKVSPPQKSMFKQEPQPVMAAAPPLPPTPKPVMSAPPPPPKVAPAPTPPVLAKPTNLPVIEPLELMAPHIPVPPPPPASAYKPDYDHMPGLRVMPQRVEDLHLQNRAPLIQHA